MSNSYNLSTMLQLSGKDIAWEPQLPQEVGKLLKTCLQPDPSCQSEAKYCEAKTNTLRNSLAPSEDSICHCHLDACNWNQPSPPRGNLLGCIAAILACLLKSR
jgi:hypothetical protein